MRIQVVGQFSPSLQAASTATSDAVSHRKARRALREDHQAIRVRERKGTQQYAVERAENCGVSSDTQREGEHRDQSERLGVEQLTQRELQISYQAQGASAALG